MMRDLLTSSKECGEGGRKWIEVCRGRGGGKEGGKKWMDSVSQCD